MLEALGSLGFRPDGFDRFVGDTAASRRAVSGAPIGHAKAALDVKALKHTEGEAKESETAYGFAARMFTRLGVCLRVDQDGKLLLGSPDYQQAASYTLVQDMTGATPGNRMLDGIEIEDSNDDQFSECIVRGSTPDTIGQTVSALPRARILAKAIHRTTPTPQSSSLGLRRHRKPRPRPQRSVTSRSPRGTRRAAPPIEATPSPTSRSTSSTRTVVTRNGAGRWRSSRSASGRPRRSP